MAWERLLQWFFNSHSILGRNQNRLLTHYAGYATMCVRICCLVGTDDIVERDVAKLRGISADSSRAEVTGTPNGCLQTDAVLLDCLVVGTTDY